MALCLGVAQAAAEFLNFKMIDTVDAEELETTSRKRRGAAEPNPNHLKLRTVVQFCHESEVSH